MPDLPAARCPAGLEASPVVDWINTAVKNAPASVKAHKLDPNDWFWILVAALDWVVSIRDNTPHLDLDRQMTVTHVVQSDFDLAYADHYLQMRADAFNFGPEGTTTLRNAALNYEKIKVNGLARKTGSGEISPVTDVSLFWALKGIEDGVADRKTHAYVSHPLWRANELVRFGIANILAKDTTRIVIAGAKRLGTPPLPLAH